MTVAFQQYVHEGVQTTNVAMSVLPAHIAFLCRLVIEDEVAESVGGCLQNMVVMELCQGGSLLKVLQDDDGRRKPREFGWCAAV